MQFIGMEMTELLARGQNYNSQQSQCYCLVVQLPHVIFDRHDRVFERAPNLFSPVDADHFVQLHLLLVLLDYGEALADLRQRLAQLSLPVPAEERARVRYLLGQHRFRVH